MHAMRLLEKWLQRNAVIGHRARVDALVRVVGALLSGGKLALTDLGRHRAGQAFVKHHIKAVDRLLGNRHLHRERDGVYRALVRTVLGGVARPVILVDWADSAFAHKQLILKAAVPVKGRAISIYEEVHPMGSYNNAGTHRRFLHRLQSVLPEGCRPIVVTDAGFRGPWFRDVEALGWDWVGRIRNRIKYLRPETGAGASSIRCTDRPPRGYAISDGDACRASTGTGAGCIWCAHGALGRAGLASAELLARSIGRCTELRGCSPPRCLIIVAPPPASSASTPSACRSRRPFATSNATASDSRCATRERSAPSVSKPCCSSPRSPR